MWIRHPKFRWINRLSPVQSIMIFYVFAVTVAFILLALPVSQQNGVDIAKIDLLFTSVSAVSVTGLSTISIVDTFSTTGVFLLSIILQLGGIGVMTVGTLIWIIFGKKIGLKERRLIMTDQNQTSFQGMVRLIKQILLLILTIEFIGFIVLGTYFIQYFPTVSEAYFQGFFASVSATTNAGFDITGESLVLFKDDYFVQFINMLLIVLGAIGFPVLIEVKEYLFASSEERRFMRFSLFTKLTTLTFMMLVVVGTIVIALLDFNHFFAGKSWHEILFYSLFQSVTTRSGGLSTMDVSQLTDQSHLFMSALMFIGASPSSAGGGIRTTTFALVVIFILTFARGKSRIHLFKREVYDEDLFKAVAVTLMALLTVFMATVIIKIMEPYSISEIIFEVCSAFGTVGLSLGITDALTSTSKVVLMILMFMGRIGILTFLFSFQKRGNNTNYHYPKEKIIIG